jgi:hypothetical protein
MGVLLSSFALRRVTFFGPLSFNLAQAAAPAAAVFSFRLWYRNRLNVGWLGLFIGIFVSAAMYSMVVSGGRRLLLSIFLGPLLYVYWTQMRYWGRARVICALGLAGVLIFGVGIVYSKFRYHVDLLSNRRTTTAIVGQIRELRAKGDWLGVLLREPLQYIGQGNAQFALLTKRYVSQGVLVPVPLNTLRFLVAYPIPRNVWPTKPQVLGVRITHEAARIPDTNWGVGVAGQGAYEGGIPALMLYAVLLTFGVRLMDEPLRLQPDNPFLIYMHASALPHVMAITRGDMGVMTMQVGQCMLFAVMVGFACRAIFGTQRQAMPSLATTYSDRHGVPRSLQSRRGLP